MLTQVHYPYSLVGDDLDHYLGIGWFRSGQMIYTSKILNFDGELFSPVRIRLPLHGYEFRKNLRKHWNKNQRLFRTEVGKAKFNAEKENLYQVHKKRFQGYVSETLVASMLEVDGSNIYNTFEIAVYDEDTLVAVSFFDLGKKSMASIMGLFHPDYTNFSLGFYTMLAEIDFGKKNGYQYYYPGYMIPGYPKFDYKLRIGEVQFYHAEEDVWLPFQQMKPSELPAQKNERKLLEISELLTKNSIDHKLYFYPLFDKGYLANVPEMNDLQSPLFIKCSTPKTNLSMIIEYHLEKQCYQIAEYHGFLQPILNEFNSHPHQTYETFRILLILQQVFLLDESAQVIVDFLRDDIF